MHSGQTPTKNPDELSILAIGREADLETWIRAALEGIPHRVVSWERLDAGGTPAEAEADLALICEEETGDFADRLSSFKAGVPRCQILLFGRPGSTLTPKQLGPVVRHWFFRPFEHEAVLSIIQAAGRSIARERREKLRHSRSLTGLDTFIGQHPLLLETLETARKVAASPTTSVLIQGETGTGKGLLARAIHGESPRADGPFIDINCAAISPALLESELFGHVKGAFTSAVRDKPGLLELADGGTAFLDEIGELDGSLQVKILKFLDDGMIRRVQGTSSAKVDVRMIAATNRDLEKEVGAGRFRLDLFHRLNVLVLRLPSLRQRSEDIPLLASHYLAELSRRMRGREMEWTEEALHALSGYAWPGNVRELINVTERLVLLSEGSRPLGLADLPSGLIREAPACRIDLSAPAAQVILPPEGFPYEAIERAVLEAALALTSGNVTRAAALLHMGRGSLRYQLQRLGIEDRASGRRGRPMGRRRVA